MTEILSLILEAGMPLLTRMGMVLAGVFALELIVFILREIFRGDDDWL